MQSAYVISCASLLEPALGCEPVLEAAPLELFEYPHAAIAGAQAMAASAIVHLRAMFDLTVIPRSLSERSAGL